MTSKRPKPNDGNRTGDYPHSHYRRVESVLRSRPDLKKTIEPREVEIQPRDSTKKPVSKIVYTVTNALGKRGSAFFSTSTDEIAAKARELLAAGEDHVNARSASKSAPLSLGENLQRSNSTNKKPADETESTEGNRPEVSVGSEVTAPSDGDHGKQSGGVEFVESSLDEVRSTNSTNSTPTRSFQQVTFPPESLIADYVDLAREQLESADSYIVGSIIPVLSGLLARRVLFPWGEEKVFPNIFAMLAGKPGDRKSTAINFVESIAREVLPMDRFMTHRFSGESLYNEFDADEGGNPDKILIVDDANPILTSWTKPRMARTPAPRSCAYGIARGSPNPSCATEDETAMEVLEG
jgi:hypothetical protein